ncbi:MAG TPA: formylglycine-generating enzyme family protein [Humisphaera sp.]|nr:formylglycine-generating enzyme family protein [Humisphaera sp.]
MNSKTLLGKKSLRSLAAGLFCIALLAGGSLTRAQGVNGMQPFVEKLPGSEASFKMVPIPAGTFKMGSPDSEKGRKPDEGPQFDVKVDAFYMGETAITWDAYTEFLANYPRVQANGGAGIVPKDKLADAVTYPTPIYDMEAGPKLQRMGGRTGKYPAVIMSQFAAKQFTKWLSKKTGRFYRLPTEAEWEYACRAGTTTAYPFGNDIGKDGATLKEYSWYIDDSQLKDGDTGYHKVATKKPNAWGLYDMNGNVANWCIDQYDADWYKQFAGKTVSWKDCIDWPTGKTRYPRVIRGAGYDSDPEECRSAARHHSDKELNVQDPQVPKSPYWQSEGFWLGFRVVSPAIEPSEAEKAKFWQAEDDDTKASSNRDRDAHEVIESPKK